MAWICRVAGGAVALALFFSMMPGALAGGPKNAPPAPAPAANTWQPWVEGGGVLSTERNRGEAGLFAPLWQSSVALFFFQASGKVFEDDIEEGNFALGFRRMHRSGWNLGLWAGHDVRNSELDNTFHQLAFGFEMLSDRWDVRANGYVALSDPEASPSTAQAFLSGNTVFMTGGREVPLSGFDGEIGYKVFGTSGGSRDGGPAARGRSHELRVFAGGFYFDDDDALEEVAGPRARIEWRIDDVIAALPGSRLTFEGEFQYDEVREEQWEGGVRLRVPFGSGSKAAYAAHLTSLTPQERRMTERIERDTDIVTGASEEEAVFNTLTGVTFDRVAVVEGGGDLQGTLDANGANSLVVLDGGTTTGSVTVGSSQTLQGGGSTIQVTGARSGVTAGFTAPGARPLIVQTLNQAVVTVDSNTHLTGLDIRGDSSAGFRNNGIVPLADGVSNVAITDATLMDLDSAGIRFRDDHDTVLISGVSVQNVDDLGIIFGDDNSSVTIANTSIANANIGGIAFDRGNSSVSIENVTLRDAGDSGISFTRNNSNVTIANAVIDDVYAGILFLDGNSDVTLKTVSVQNVAEDGIAFRDRNSRVALKDVSVDTVMRNGIVFRDGNNDVTLETVTVDSALLGSISFRNDNSNVAISNTSFSSSSLINFPFGIAFDSGNSFVSIENVTIRNVAGAGIFFDNNNSDVTIANTSIANANSDGIIFGHDNSNVTLSGNTLTNISGDGIAIFNDNSNVTLSGNTVTNVGNNAILLFNNNSNVTVSGNSVSNARNNGIFLNGGNSATITDNTLTDIAEDAINVGGSAANTLTITDNTFAGTIWGNAVEFDGQVDTLLDGSGNQLAPGVNVGGSTCALELAGDFVGTLQIGAFTFVDGAGC